MERFKASELVSAVETLLDLERFHYLHQGLNAPSVIDDDQHHEIAEAFMEAYEVCRQLHLVPACQKILNSHRYFKNRRDEITTIHAETEIRNVREAVRDGLGPYQFIKVADGRDIYIEKVLLGQTVREKFRKAIPDIDGAKNCLMAGCDTAAVFHLMRVVEWGLRALCVHLGLNKLKAKIKKSGVITYRPIEYSEWENILDGLQEQVDKKIVKLKRGESKQKEQEFYYPILQDIRGIRDAWRNHVMHTRADYSSNDANVITGHVKRIMNKLSERVFEV